MHDRRKLDRALVLIALALAVLAAAIPGFGHGRDVFTLDGAVPGGVSDGVPAASVARVRFPDAAPRSVAARFNEETIVMRRWPMADGHISIAELHY